MSRRPPGSPLFPYTPLSRSPRLLVRAAERRAARVARGEPASPVKVTVTSRCDIDPAASFFAAGEVDKLVYCATQSLPEDRKSTRLNSSPRQYLVCRLLLEKK